MVSSRSGRSHYLTHLFGSPHGQSRRRTTASLSRVAAGRSARPRCFLHTFSLACCRVSRQLFEQMRAFVPTQVTLYFASFSATLQHHTPLTQRTAQRRALVATLCHQRQPSRRSRKKAASGGVARIDDDVAFPTLRLRLYGNDDDGSPELPLTFLAVWIVMQGQVKWYL
jgi:hypothetical protein